jgi:hypothetical protein
LIWRKASGGLILLIADGADFAEKYGGYKYFPLTEFVGKISMAYGGQYLVIGE